MGPRAPERADLLTAQAGAHMGAGQWREAYAAIRESLTLTASPPVPVIATTAALENMLGHHQVAHQRLQAALADLPDERSADAVILMLEIARDALYRMRYEDMRTWSLRSLETVGAVDDRGLRATAAAGVAIAGAFAGDAEAGRAAADEAAALVDAMPDEELAQHLEFAGNALAGAEMLLDRYEVGLRHAERTFAVAEATGQGQRLPVLFWTGTVRTMVGRLRESAEVLDLAIEIARVAGHEQGMMWNLFARAFTALAAGDHATALSAAREATAVMRGVERSFPATGAGHALAAALLAHEDPAGAREALIDACGEALENVPAAWRASAFELLTRIELALGASERAAAAAGQAQACAERLPLRPVTAMADRAAAHVALAGGTVPSNAAWPSPRAATPPPHAATPSPQAATPSPHAATPPPQAATPPPHAATPPLTGPAHAALLALRSAAAFAECGAPVEAAASRALAGRALAAAGETDRAAAELDRAAEEFERCDAPGRRDACERELRGLGRRGRYRRTKPVGDGSLIGSLTERELQIARLVVDRRTNAEIAAELYLSIKTVETHLRNLFHKLGVSSRVEVARAVERADAASPAGPAAS